MDYRQIVTDHVSVLIAYFMVKDAQAVRFDAAFLKMFFINI